MPAHSALDWLVASERRAVLGKPLARVLSEELGRSGAPDPGLPGRVYERWLAGDGSARRSQGSFYTSDCIVDFVVARTIGPLLDRCELFSLRILDPACGGGAFLLGALRFLEQAARTQGLGSGMRLRKRLARCVVGIDLDPRAVEVCRMAIELWVGGGALAGAPLSLFCADALLDDVDARPSAIIGNPPWGQKGIRVSPDQRLQYKQRFQTSVGTFDPFKLFVERTHQLLEPGGRWGLVLPDIVLLKDYQLVRDLMLEGSALHGIAHLGRAFDDVNLDAVAILGEKASAIPKGHRVSIWHQLPRDGGESAAPAFTQVQSVFQELPGHKLNLYLRDSDLDLWRKLRTMPRLASLFEMHEGVHSGNVRDKLFVDERGPLCRKLILGRCELARFRLTWQGKYIDTRPDLLDRSAGEYANLGRSAWHQSPKLVVRRTGDRVIAAYDSVGYYVSNNLFVLLPRQAMSEEELLARVAVLNSRALTWYFRAEQPRTGRLFAELKLIHLRDFPQPAAERFAAVRRPLAELARALAGGQDDGLEAELDDHVESAFELSPAERALIRLCK